MDAPTVAVYERCAAEYEGHRRAREPERAAALALHTGRGIRLDLGCGPGLYLEALGEPTIGLDAAMAMLRQAKARAPHSWLVQADLEHPPIRPGAIAGAWASKSLQHVPAGALPLALARLQRTMGVGARLELTMFSGAPSFRSDDDLPGRLFECWDADELIDVLTGAGFSVTDVEVGEAGHSGLAPLLVSAVRARTLADTVAPGMRLLCCGLNPSVYSADAGVPFARPGNRFWPAVREAGLTKLDRDADRLAREAGIGLTDLVKRATVAASEVSAGEYRKGIARIERLCNRMQPAAVCFVGLAGWRAAADHVATAGWQARRLGGTPVYVMPSTSGLNARTPLAELATHLRAAVVPARETRGL